MKIHPVGDELLQLDRQTDRHEETTSLFCNFANTAKNSTFCPHSCIYVFCVNLRTNSDYFPIQH